MYNLNCPRKELTPQKLGTFCAYYAKMSFASYEDKKSEPEYGINILQRNMSELEKYKINKAIDRFI